MSDEHPKIYLTDEQWAVIQTEERRRTKMQADAVCEQARLQQRAVELMAESIAGVAKVSKGDRDSIAVQALVGILSGLCSGAPRDERDKDMPRAFNRLSFSHAASDAYTIADAMLKARDAE